MASVPLKESDYIGKRYGQLTILKFDGYKNGSTSLYVSVLCDCGNTKSVQLCSLKRGSTKSCGCINKTNPDIYIGKTYNRLTITNYYRNDNGELMLVCNCACGQSKAIRFYDVISSKTKSCGCLSIETTIKNNKSRKMYNDFEYIDQYTVKVLLSNCDEYMICDANAWNVLRYYLWRKHYSGYANTDLRNGNVAMFHVMILECPEGYIRDHINRNRLDNRFSNLRVITPTGNAINRALSEHNKSGNAGVYYDKHHNRWRSYYSDPTSKRKIFSDFNTYEEALEVGLQEALKLIK